MQTPVPDIGPHHAALFQSPTSGNPDGTLAILLVLLLLLFLAGVLLCLGIAFLAWLLRPSNKDVDVVPLKTDGDVLWIPVAKDAQNRRHARPGDRKAGERGRSGR